MKDRKPSKTENEGRRHAIRFAGFIIVFGILFFSLQYLLTPDYDTFTEEGEPALHSGRTYARIMEHELYTSEDNIDLLILGSSHVYWQYDPSIIDESLNVHSFVAGTSSQPLDASCALLVEAGKTNSIDTVWMELCPTNKGEIYSERKSFSKIYISSDYLKPGLNKIKFILNASNSEYYVNSFFPLLRNKQSYLDRNYLLNSIKRKRSYDYLNYIPPGTSSEDEKWYEERGFIGCSTVVENEDWSKENKLSPFPEVIFSEDEMDSLKNIIDYCKKRQLRLVFISTPLTDFTLAQYGNYDEGREHIARLAEENELEFYDFNLCRPEFFTFESEKFLDRSHMNYYGAEEYSKLLGRFFSGQIDPDDLFYDSYEEKLEAMENRVFGLVYTIDTDGDDKVIHLEPVANAEFPVYASIRTVSAGGEEKNISEKQILEDLHFDKSETGTIIVEILGDDPEGDITNTIHIEY